MFTIRNFVSKQMKKLEYIFQSHKELYYLYTYFLGFYIDALLSIIEWNIGPKPSKIYTSFNNK